MIEELFKCRCETPTPAGPFVYGAFQMCTTCRKIANWKQFEDDIREKPEMMSPPSREGESRTP